MKPHEEHPVAMAVIDGELWFRYASDDPVRANTPNPKIVAAIEKLGEGWHTGTFRKNTKREQLDYRLRRVRRRLTRHAAPSG